jgi:YhcH/YjgK/YiaL family protein
VKNPWQPWEQACDILSLVIIDRLADSLIYSSLAQELRQALDYLRRADLASAPAGRHDVDGDRVFALLQDYTTRPADQCVWEAHRKYADVQYVVRGVERMGYQPLAHAREREPYDSDRDVAYFEPGSDYVTVREGMFVIFTPHDVHSPSVAAGEPSAVRKVVVKVALG